MAEKGKGRGGARFGVENGMLGKKHTEETKAKIRAKVIGENNGFYGKKHTPETKALMSKLRKQHPSPMKGRHHSEETKRKISEAKKGQKPALVTRQEVSKNQLGKPSHSKGCKWSEESKAQLSKSIAKWNASLTPEQKQEYSRRQSAALKGRVFTDEWKANLREARKHVLLGSTPFSSKQFKQGKYFSKKGNKDIIYQSSYELAAFEMLEIRREVVSYDRCPYAIPYTLEDGLHNYIPDIFIKFDDGEDVVVEVKPEFMLTDPVTIIKHLEAAKFFDERDISFEVWTEEELGLYPYNK